MKKNAMFVMSFLLSNGFTAYAAPIDLTKEMVASRSVAAVAKKTTPKKKPAAEAKPGKKAEATVQIPYESVIEEAPKDAYPREILVKIYNDKEVAITAFDKDEKARIQNKFTDQSEKESIKKLFLDNLYVYLNNQDRHCEMSYINKLINDFAKAKKVVSEDELIDYFKMLRVAGTIDDIYFEILEGLTKDHFALKKVDLARKAIRSPVKNYEKRADNTNVDEFFSAFKNYPDEVESCSIAEYLKLQRAAGKEKDTISKKNSEIRDLSYVALKNGVIDLATFNKIKFLAEKSTLNERYIWLNDYLNIVFSAKNKMIPFKRNYKVVNLEDESKFSTERIRRFSDITRRKLLYRKYDENQIIMLTQVMKKASQRMGVDPDTKTAIPYLVHEFTVESQTGEQNYVERIELDTQSQFNLARRLLRKDIVALQMMESFQKVQISYNDVVMASLETGYISLDDIEYVVKYDDLWNPEISKKERMLNMTFRIAGYSTFFLPPPWNVTGALALSIIEGIVDSRNINGADNDNPNTFIE